MEDRLRHMPSLSSHSRPFRAASTASQPTPSPPPLDGPPRVRLPLGKDHTGLFQAFKCLLAGPAQGVVHGEVLNGIDDEGELGEHDHLHWR